MSATVGQETVPEMHHVQTAAAKVSMFMGKGKGKAGFVIPKNKFSGSLVPRFRPTNKSDNSAAAAATEENTKHLQRNTKWGPDLTQDPAVKRGRALAYQTRVDQITQQLKLESLGGDGQLSEVVGDVQDREPMEVIDYEKLKSLELERREVIGEILKLNPNYKAPSDYQAVTREVTVPIPVKEHPGFNFVGLLYGPDGDTHKRLEKETGTKMQVYGIKSETREKVEVTASDSSEVLRCLDELYVRIAADTYEKVDAAAALLEMLLSSVPGKSDVSKASDSESGDKMLILSEGQDLATVSAVSTGMEATTGPLSTSSQGPFQQFQGSWFPTSQPNMPSGVGPVPNSMAFPFNPSAFAPRPPTQYGFGSSPQNIQVGPPRSHPSLQVMQGPSMLPPNPFGQAGPPRNHSVAMSPSPLMGRPAVNSPGWAQPPSGAPQSIASGSFISQFGPSQISASSATPQRFPSQGGPTSATSFVPVQSFGPQALHNPPMNTLLRPGSQVSAPPPPSRPPLGMSNPNVGPLNAAPTFTPLRPMGGPTPTPRPLLPNSNDFTFLPQRPQGPPQTLSGPSVHFASQRPPQGQLPPPPQHQSFRQNTMPQHRLPNFPRPQMGPHSGGQFGPPSPNPQMGPRNLGPGPHQMPSPGGPFPPRMGHSPQYHQQSYPGGSFVTNQHHPNSSGRPQVYDPFGPTSVASAQGNNISVSRRQESDPEYEDLMASVGVK